jgi:hypothetical protein
MTGSSPSAAGMRRHWLVDEEWVCEEATSACCKGSRNDERSNKRQRAIAAFGRQEGEDAQR